MNNPVLFARVGWMTFYNGAREERPLGGGSYNIKNIGSELFNFKPYQGNLYGFVNAGKGRKALNLRRIDPAAKGKPTLDDVTVVFIAKQPREGRQRIIGWYRGSTAYGEKQDHPLKIRDEDNIEFCLKAPVSSACLLPTAARTHEVPHGKGGIGQSNVCYFRAGEGWMIDAFDYVEAYTGPNLLTDENAEAEQSEVAEIVIENAAGFETNPKIRRAVEEHAMRRATKHFVKQGFAVKPLGKPYDLLCTKNGEKKFIEVKGTRTAGAAVALTRNEVEFLKKNAQSAALFVVHSIKLKGGNKPIAYGGEVRLIEPWNPSCGELMPITYFLKFS